MLLGRQCEPEGQTGHELLCGLVSASAGNAKQWVVQWWRTLRVMCQMGINSETCCCNGWQGFSYLLMQCITCKLWGGRKEKQQ